MRAIKTKHVYLIAITNRIMDKLYLNDNVCFYPVKGFEGLYWINENGDVYSKRKRFLVAHKDRYGYLKLGLSKNGNRYWFTIHRLVALNFIDNPNKKPCVNHIDGNKLNNSTSNLEWCTVTENNRHSWKIGNSKVSPNAVAALKKKLCKKVLQLNLNGETIKEWSGIREAARGVGGESSCISEVCRSLRKTHKGFIWKFST